MSDVVHSLESGTQTTTSPDGALVLYPNLAGEVVSACSIDLPRNDVLEGIDFERFFLLNLGYGDLRGPAMLAFGRREDQLLHPVPLSADRDDLAWLGARPSRPPTVAVSDPHRP